MWKVWPNCVQQITKNMLANFLIQTLTNCNCVLVECKLRNIITLTIPLPTNCSTMYFKIYQINVGKTLHAEFSYRIFWWSPTPTNTTRILLAESSASFKCWCYCPLSKVFKFKGYSFRFRIVKILLHINADQTWWIVLLVLASCVCACVAGRT